ncbi:GNAT family N-acetyltransferase [Haloimpatiens sp. FM7330]|uniref:GNAT family N-acetyltransferase n=1 Tax=Haloimpatiens sp. FM7330 TaxID=3298610 RepID=UPI00363580BF
MKIVKALNEDLSNIMLLISSAVKKMNMEGSYQWDNCYPNEEVISTDIKENSLYILKDGENYLGIIVLNEEQPVEYKDVNWENSIGNILVIHRMAVNPLYQGQGIAKKLMQFTEEFALKNNYLSIRTDTYIENIKMQSLFTKCGYNKTGSVFFNNGKQKPFLCYEKIINLTFTDENSH